MRRANEVPIMVPLLGTEEEMAVLRVLKSRWLTQGEEVAAFEREFAQYVGAKHACAVSSCTTALHLALKCAGVDEGSEVITASHSFIATANSIRYCGATPIFIDIDPVTYNLNPSHLENAITDRTAAILAVHQMGMPCDLSRILEIADRRGIPVVEDAACAIGSEILFQGRWEKIGRPHGTTACFSFHPRKLLTTGDGGMITTSDETVARRLRLLRQHGMSISDKARHESKTPVFEEYLEVGYNYRLTDLQAAIGREQLKRLPHILSERKRRVEMYREQLKQIPQLQFPSHTDSVRPNWQSLCLRLPDGIDPKTVIGEGLSQGIALRRGIMCAHREKAYSNEPWSFGGEKNLKQSEQAQDQCLLVPLFHEMTDTDQTRVVELLKNQCTKKAQSGSTLRKAG